MRGDALHRGSGRWRVGAGSAALLIAAVVATGAAKAGDVEPPHSDPLPSCVDSAKVHRSTKADPFNVRYTVRCDFTVNRINFSATRKIARLKATPTVDPAAVAPFTCQKTTARKVSCHGDSGPPNTRIILSLRVVKPGPCKRPKLRLTGNSRGIPYCPSGPCTSPIVGDELGATVAGC